MFNIANHQGNAHQNYNEISPITSHLSEWLSSKRSQITNVGDDVEKREPSYTVHGNVKGNTGLGYYEGQTIT